MALIDLVTGGTYINGLYQYEPVTVNNMVDSFGRKPKATGLSLNQLVNMDKQELVWNIQQPGPIMVYSPRSGQYKGIYLIACTNQTVYRFVTPPTPGPSNPSRPNPPMGSGKVFKAIRPDDRVEGLVEESYYPLWSDDTSLLQNHHITSSQAGYDYCIEVYDKVLTDDCSERQYNVVFGDYTGRGAEDEGGYDDETMTQAMYMQYRNLLLDSSQEKFNISGSDVDSVFILDVRTGLVQDSIKLGDWKFDIGKFSLAGSGSTDTGSVSYSASVVSYIDNFYRDKNRKTYSNKSYSIFRSGSSDEVGIFYPSHGVYVFDALEFGNVNLSGSVSGKNAYMFYQAISGSSAGSSTQGLRAKNVDIVYSDMYFLTAQNAEFNHSNNPTFVSGSEGVIIQEMSEQTSAYITSIGLYNEEKELMAIGKVSKALQKTFTEESLFTVKLKY